LPDSDAVTVGTQPFVAGATFTVTINLVDQFFNKSNTENTFVRISADDPFDNLAALGSLQTGAGGYVTGQTAFVNASLVTRSTTAYQWQITASTATGDAYNRMFSCGCRRWCRHVQILCAAV
jgi:hypothetical protein